MLKILIEHVLNGLNHDFTNPVASHVYNYSIV